MSSLNMFNEMLFTHSDPKVDDSKLDEIVTKMQSVLSQEEIDILNAVGEKLTYAKVKEDFVDRYEAVDSSHLNNIFKRYIWDGSEDWANEMYPVSDGIMSNLNMLESDAIKRFIIELNKRDNIND